MGRYHFCFLPGCPWSSVLEFPIMRLSGSAHGWSIGDDSPFGASCGAAVGPAMSPIFQLGDMTSTMWALVQWEKVESRVPASCVFRWADA